MLSPCDKPIQTASCFRSRAFRHTERNIADTGLNLLLEICMSFETSDFATQFYQAYHLQLLQEVFAVMTGARLCCVLCCTYNTSGAAGQVLC